MRKLATFLHIIDVISEWTGKIVSFTIILIIGTAVFWVLQRVFLFATWFDYGTTTKIFFVYVIFGAAYALRVQAHVNVEILHSRLPLRVRSIVDLVTSISFFLFLIAMLWMAAGDARGFHLSLRTFWPQNWPVALLATIGISLFFLQALSKFIRDLVIAITGKEAP